MAPPEPAWDPVGPALYHQAAHGHKPRVPSDRWPNTSPKGSAGPDPIQSMAMAWPRQVSRCPGCLGGPLPRVRPPNLPSSRGPFLPVGSLSLFPQATACTPCAPSSRRPPAVSRRRPTPHCQAGMAGLLALPLQTCSFLRVSVPTGSSAQSHVCTRLRKQLACWSAEGGAPFPLEAPVAGAQPRASPGHICRVAPSTGQAPGCACSLCWGLCVAACPLKAGSSVCFQNPHLEELSCRRWHSFPKFPA